MPVSDPPAVAAGPDAHSDALPYERRGFGLGLRFCSASCFAVMAAALKLASLRGVNGPEMIFYRNGFALPIVLAWILRGPGLAAVRTRRPMAHLVRSGIGLISLCFTFEALILLPLAEATTITFSAPIFATVLSVLLLSERVGVHRWCAVAIGFVGVLVVVRPGGATLPAIGIGVAIGAAIGQALVAITLRQIGRSEGTAAIVFWFTILTTLAGAATLPWFGHRHDAHSYALLAVAGLFGGTAQLTMTASLRHAPVAVVAPLDYVQMLWAAVFGWLLFATPPTAATLVGAVLNAGGGVLTAWREHVLRREAIAATPHDL